MPVATLLHTLKWTFEAATRTRIYRHLPHGVSLRQDLARSLPLLQIPCVLDVGANVGQSAHRFRRWFPSARILAFEPAGDTFLRLQRALADDPNAQALRLALGATRGTTTLTRHALSVMARTGLPPGEDGPTEVVPLETLDAFCAAEGLAHIGFLKVDTEGSDLEVLKGAAGLLSEHRIDLVQVEAGMHPGNRWHVPMEDLKPFLEAQGYVLFGVYDQAQEWPTGQPHLRRVDLVFIAPTLIGFRDPLSA